MPDAVEYGGGQASHQSVSRPYGKQRSIVQSKTFGAAHASVSQVDISMELAEIQLALGANRPVAVGHAAVTHAPAVAAGYHAHPAGQVSHQLMSKPYQGEHRSTTQSKAFGAGVAAVADSPNRLHGARGVVTHPVAHAIGHPVAHALAHPVAHAVAHPVAHAIAHPVAHAVAPVVHHASIVAHHAGYVHPDLAEPSPYTCTHAVADGCSGAAFNQAESNDGTDHSVFFVVT